MASQRVRERHITQYMDTKKMRSVLVKTGINSKATGENSTPSTATDKTRHKRNIKNITLLLARVEHKLQRRLAEKPSRETLDRLALFVGFQDWDSFCQEVCDRPANGDSNKEEEE